MERLDRRFRAVIEGVIVGLFGGLLNGTLTCEVHGDVFAVCVVLGESGALVGD
jgi:hypothetical protein